MAERHHRDRRDRVEQLRTEAGVPLSPESVEVRQAQLVEMQMVSSIPPMTGLLIFEILSSHEGELGDSTSGNNFHSRL